MRACKTWLFAVLGALLSTSALAQTPGPASAASGAGTDKEKSATASSQAGLDRVLELIFKREQNEMTAFSLYKPIVETYIQELKPDKDMGLLPNRDAYYLGQADLSRGIAVRSILPHKGGPLGLFDVASDGDWQTEGFLQMIYVDHYHFDKQHYQFRYAGRDFLGEVRCLVFDITPARKSGDGRFKGRIWVEDRDFTIVRFNGVFVPHGFEASRTAHFDSWRLNVQPDVWLPAYIFSGELNHKRPGLPLFKAQTRFWAYDLKATSHEDEFSDLVVDPESQVHDETAQQEHDRSPVQAARAFQREAEGNALDVLVRLGLIAPEGDVDKVLNTVLNNLEVTNNLDIEPEPHCRVMLTSNIELFSVGHTIVLSRGLLDVLPDEATLAAMIAQELADAMNMKPSMTQYGFGDVLQTSTTQAMVQFSFKDDQEDWQATRAKTLELLRNSPYRSKLGTAALFLQQLSRESKLMPHLISPNLGNRVYPVAELMNSGPMLEPAKIDQIAALPMGARIKLDPWSDRIEMVKAKQVALQSAREKLPFEITPFMPYLTRYQDATTPQNSNQATVSGKEQPQPQPNR